MTAPDKYDEAIDYLTEHPEKIRHAWGNGLLHGEDDIRARGSVLFDMAGTSSRVDGKWCGCLTQIRYDKDRVAATPELTAAIRADHRIPTDPRRITVDDLPVFAEWQRRLDKWHAAQAVSS